MPIVKNLTSVIWENEEFELMIENYELILRILRYFAQDVNEYPANLSFEQLQAAFNDTEADILKYHLWICMELRLLNGEFTHSKAWARTELLIIMVHGLTQSGGEYFRHSEAGIWNRALEELNDRDLPITTRNLIDSLGRLRNQEI
ncbi:MAG: hypothetical protein OXG88_12005 [Gammaproteobacteria bacterium]|nr:hypothetical protein [Gammaproteobacteria bacterium]